MNSKAVFLLGLLFVVAVLVSSSVAVETKNEVNPVNEEKYGGYGGGWGRGGGGYGGGGGRRCCGKEKAQGMTTEAQPENMNKAEEPNPMKEEKYGGWGGGWGGGGRCCGKEKQGTEAQKP